MKFEDYKYEKVDMKKFSEQFNHHIERFNESKTFQEQNGEMTKLIEMRNHFETMATLVEIRQSIDTKDEFYDKEKNYYDEIRPIYQGLVTNYYKSLINSKFKNDLVDEWGEWIFKIAELEIKTYSDEIVEDLKLENKLSTEYSKLLASAEIEYDGKVLNLSQMGPYLQSKDRETRKEAAEKTTEFFEENETKFDEIYDKLVKLRDRMAKKLGFENFTELGYLRMGRSEYGPKEVAVFREQVLKNIVPIANKIRKKQEKRLGLDKIKYYDEPLEYLTGNAKPKGDKDWMVNKAKKMYAELSPETNEFFKFMTDKNLLDLETKPGKSMGGYCTYIPEYKSPFIFANFNGTSADVDVLTHEAGHAFQNFRSRDFSIPEYIWPTLEACEIHSMSMEFITWPWMNLFFREETDKYKYSHLSSGILFIPYGVTVDEFQHWVYENPEASPKERKETWRKIEKKYLPLKDYDGKDFYERGGYWFRQGHIFRDPFYYIDYTLAQICAYQYWIKFNEDRNSAWKDYLKLCDAGGSKPFLELVKYGNLESPFKKETVENISTPIDDWLSGIDDSNF
ncbi:MAG: M3 family oligoendopeptidase [Tissierellales bacterium]|nr:M3 family oligoendopeptidase [Tissierellales bacterium]